MSNHKEETANVSETEPTQSGTSKTKSRTGKSSKARRNEGFRRSVGAKQLAERRAEVVKRLFLFDESTLELERSLNALAISTQPVAIPIPIATRGAGFACVVEYSRMITTWNANAIEEICTVHQYYRVTMYLLMHKMYYARYDQGESVSFDVEARFVMNEEVRQILGPVTQVPIATYNILCAIGKVDATAVFHSFPPQVVESGEQAALYLTPMNIRATLVELANPDSDRDFRDHFHALNPLPGARWGHHEGVGWTLTNVGDIWAADYGPQELQRDVHCYQNLLTRVSGRLPKSFISSFSWNGKAAKSALVCMDTLPLRLEAQFLPVATAARRTTKKKRDACGRLVTVPAEDVSLYESDIIQHAATVSTVWGLEKDLTSLEMISGAASFVGEQAQQPTRLQIQGRIQAHIAPGTMLYKLVDAPRPSTS